MPGTSPSVIVQHVGPLEGGGIATVVVSLVETLRGLPELEVEAVASTIPGGRAGKLVTGLRADLHVRKRSRLPRVVHLHTAWGISFWRKAWLLDAAKASGARTVLHVHSGGFEPFVRRARSIARMRIEQSMAAADLILAVNEVQRRFLEDRFQRAVEVLPNAVHVPDYVAPPAVPPFRWFHLGHIRETKGTWDLLDALALLSDQASWELLLIGDGNLAEAERRAASFGDRVKILGWRSTAEVASLLQSAHALVLPSHFEGLPMSVLEAMAAGRAAVVTPVGGLPELIHEDRNGRLVPLRDPASLARAMEQVMADGVAERLGMAARATVAEEHNLDRVAERLCAIYLELAHAPKR